MRQYRVMRTVLGGWRLAVVAAGLGPALVACAPLSCTAVGCVSAVTVDVASLSAKARPFSVQATLCVEGACQTQKVTFLTDANDTVLSQELPTDPKPANGMEVPVTLKVTQGTTVLLDTKGTATLTQVAPNGTRCGPICYSADLTLDGQDFLPSTSPSASG
jgi:hypothetical protein